jgi:hypothetical protein
MTSLWYVDYASVCLFIVRIKCLRFLDGAGQALIELIEYRIKCV